MEIAHVINRKGRVIDISRAALEAHLNKRGPDGKIMFRRIDNPDQRYYPQFDETIVAQPEHQSSVGSTITSPLHVEIIN